MGEIFLPNDCKDTNYFLNLQSVELFRIFKYIKKRATAKSRLQNENKPVTTANPACHKRNFTNQYILL